MTDARSRLSGYKLPDETRIVDEVPRATNGKSDYAAARALFASSTA